MSQINFLKVFRHPDIVLFLIFENQPITMYAFVEVAHYG